MHFAKKYERLAQYLAHDIQSIGNNKKVMSALSKYGQFSDSQIKNALKWGQGPEINIKQLDHLKAFGAFDSGIKSNILNIDVDLVEALENAKGRDRDYLLFLVAVTILHEYTHYGDDQDGIDYKGKIGEGEEGNAFEIEAYGKFISKPEAEKLIDKYIQDKNDEKQEGNKKKAALNNIIKNFNNLTQGKYVWNGDDFVQE